MQCSTPDPCPGCGGADADRCPCGPCTRCGAPTPTAGTEPKCARCTDITARVQAAMDRALAAALLVDGIERPAPPCR